MKKFINTHLALLIFAGLFLSSALAIGQDIKARLSVEYLRTVGSDGSINVNVKFKGDDGYEPGTMLPLNVYHEVAEDSLVKVGEVTTDMEGNASFVIAPTAPTDSVMKHTFLFKIENSEKFNDASKSVSFLDVKLFAEIIVEDSINHVSAKLTDSQGEPIAKQKLVVMVHRLFAPHIIGESSYKTEGDGTILVPMEEPLPGVDGVLTFEVMLDARKYGNVKYIFDAPIGKPVVDLSTFDDRTMWSPPTKTPLFLWIFPNLVILGIWVTIMVLVTNLYRIYKS